MPQYNEEKKSKGSATVNKTVAFFPKIFWFILALFFQNSGLHS